MRFHNKEGMMDFEAVNWLAVLGATLVAFVLGGLWFGPLFGAAWMQAIGLDPQAVKSTPKTGLRRLMTISFLLTWCAAVNLAVFLGDRATAGSGALYGFLVGLLWIGVAIAVGALYERKSFAYVAINVGYWALAFTLMGAILGIWL
jgi:hypothetical protein